jgi:hypothetical protein
MTFKIWDNHFAGYMRGLDESEAEFDRKIDADRAIQGFIRSRTRQDEWLLRLDIHHLESELCYHLCRHAKADGSSSKPYPWLLPMFFDVPRTHWKLLADDESEMIVGTIVTRPRDDEEVTLVSLQPPHKMKFGGKSRGNRHQGGVALLRFGCGRNVPVPPAGNGSHRAWPPLGIDGLGACTNL